ERAPDGAMRSIGEDGLARLDSEASNLRVATDWSLANARPELGLRIVAPTWRWYLQRGRMREGRGLPTELLDRAEGADPAVDPEVEIAALEAAGGLAYWLADFAAAGTRYERRLALAEATGDPLLIADAHYDLGFIDQVAGRVDELRAHEQRALELY